MGGRNDCDPAGADAGRAAHGRGRAPAGRRGRPDRDLAGLGRGGGRVGRRRQRPVAVRIGLPDRDGHGGHVCRLRLAAAPRAAHPGCHVRLRQPGGGRGARLEHRR